MHALSPVCPLCAQAKAELQQLSEWKHEAEGKLKWGDERHSEHPFCCSVPAESVPASVQTALHLFGHVV